MYLFSLLMSDPLSYALVERQQCTSLFFVQNLLDQAAVSQPPAPPVSGRH